MSGKAKLARVRQRRDTRHRGQPGPWTGAPTRAREIFFSRGKKVINVRCRRKQNQRRGRDWPRVRQGRQPRAALGEPSCRSSSLPAPTEQPVPGWALSRELWLRSATALFLFLLLAARFLSSPALQAAGAGGTLSYQPQRDGGKRKEETGRVAAVPWSRARRKAWTMGGKAKGQPQAGQHEPPRRDPQQFWC